MSILVAGWRVLGLRLRLKAAIAMVALGTGLTVAGMSFGQVRGAVVLITGRPQALSFQVTATFTWTVSPHDAAATLCALDGGARVACASPWHYSGLGAGVHHFRVTAFDASGAPVGSASANWTIQRIRR